MHVLMVTSVSFLVWVTIPSTFGLLGHHHTKKVGYCYSNTQGAGNPLTHMITAAHQTILLGTQGRFSFQAIEALHCWESGPVVQEKTSMPIVVSQTCTATIQGESLRCWQHC